MADYVHEGVPVRVSRAHLPTVPEQAQCEHIWQEYCIDGDVLDAGDLGRVTIIGIDIPAR